MKARTEPADELPEHLRWVHRPRSRDGWGAWMGERMEWFTSRGLGKLAALTPDRGDR